MSTTSATFSIEMRTRAEELLRFYPGHAFCHGCLAQRLGISVREAHHVGISLIGASGFVQETWYCSICFGITHVLHAAWHSFDSLSEEN